MLENDLVEYCAPTLAGIKTGNLFSVRRGLRELLKEMQELNTLLTKRGLRLIPLRWESKYTLVYLYRPDRLDRDLKAPEAREILAQKGYPCEKPERCLVQLARHLMNDEGFPHEIGLFLGYPPGDVKGFMKSPSEGVKCIGCWKVYGNEKEAVRTFERYRQCTEVYCREAKGGRALEELIVDSVK